MIFNHDVLREYRNGTLVENGLNKKSLKMGIFLILLCRKRREYIIESAFFWLTYT